MKTFFYEWFVYPIIYFLFFLISLFHKKTHLTFRLRSWKNFLSLKFNPQDPIEYWIHVASYGELEYAIPLIQELDRKKKKVLITYYSISAQSPVEKLNEIYSNVSLVAPLPHDGLGLMKEFVQLLRQQGVQKLLLMKYELWPSLLWECNAQGIGVFLIDAVKPGWFHRLLIHKLQGIFSGYASEMEGVQHPYIQVTGDTRVERVYERVRKWEEKSKSPISFNDGKKTMILGSVWPRDNQLLFDGLRKLKHEFELDMNIFWVPHEFSNKELHKSKKRFQELGYKNVFSFHENDIGKEEQKNKIDAFVRLLSKKRDASQHPVKPFVALVHLKGILAEIYSFGQLAYVGGGFGKGVHSVLEPALFSALVGCGPRIERSPESKELIQYERLTVISNGEEFKNWILQNKMQSKKRNDHWMETLLNHHLNASQRILTACENSRIMP